MAPAGVVAVALALAGLIAAGLTWAVVPARDPLGLSDRGRTIYVYACEAVLALLCLHVWLCEPNLFRLGIIERYWLLLIMLVAFAGAGLSHFFERRQLPVLSEPLERTALALPLLPVAAFWLPLGIDKSPLLWLMTALFYGVQGYVRRSAWMIAASALAANLGLWVLWNQLDIHWHTHPQIWLIPPALAALVAEHLNRDRLAREQAAAIRFLALSTVYVASAADMFIAGVGNSWLLPLVLAALSVAGVLAGILLRIRSFVLLGVVFLTVVILTMIWHAAVGLGHTWIWYLSGIVLGLAIIALFAYFEKHRHDVLAALEKIKEWQ